MESGDSERKEYIKNLHVVTPKSPFKANTTISVKLSTRHKLIQLGSKGESYDDIVATLIKTNEILNAKVREYEKIA